MENKAKPRICEVLGVEVGEPFTADYPHKDLGKMEVREDGSVVCGTGKVRSNALCYMINHPKCVHKIPRWTPEEVELAKAIKAVWPEAEKVFCFSDGDSPGCIVLYGFDGAILTELYNFHSYRFPSLKSKEEARLSDIIGGDENVDCKQPHGTSGKYQICDTNYPDGHGGLLSGIGGHYGR